MTQWHTDMNAAPRGKTIQAQRLVTDKNSETGKSLKTVDEYQRDDVILASKCGKVIKSYWIPDENRFAGFQPGEEIVGWMAWPKHPFEMERSTEGSLETGSEEAENAREAIPETEDGSVTHAGAGESPATLYLEDCGSGA